MKINREKILIIHRGALGDFILALPAIETIKAHNPSAQCVLMGRPSIIKLLSNKDYIPSSISFDCAGIASFYVEHQGFDHYISEFFTSFDSLFIFTTAHDDIFIKNLKRIGCPKVYSLPFKPDPDRARHITDCQLTALSDQGYKPLSQIPHISVSKNVSHAVPRDKPPLFFHPGSGGRRKIWPEEYMAKVIKHCSANFDADIHIIKGPADEVCISEISAKLACPHTLVQDVELPDLAQLLSLSCGYIGNDSGISHLASALGVKSIVIFGPTDPNIWGPRGGNVKILYKGLVCSPCDTTIKECRTKQCLYSITPDDVLDAAAEHIFQKPI